MTTTTGDDMTTDTTTRRIDRHTVIIPDDNTTTITAGGMTTIRMIDTIDPEQTERITIMIFDRDVVGLIDALQTIRDGWTDEQIANQTERENDDARWGVGWEKNLLARETT